MTPPTLQQIPRGVDDALAIADLGWSVFRVSLKRLPDGTYKKTPHNWAASATRDHTKIRETWSSPNENSYIGYAMGDGAVAADVDNKHGKAGQKWWESQGYDLLLDYTYPTLSNGWHCLALTNAKIGCPQLWSAHGIDIKGEGGWLFAHAIPPRKSDLPRLPKALETALEPPVRAQRVVGDVTVRDPALGVHPYAQKAITYELERLDECARGGDLWDNNTFAVACTLIEFANSPWTGYSMEQAEADFAEHAPADAGFNPASKWASAARTVGDNGRDEPGARPEDVFGIWVDGGHPVFDATPTLSTIRQAAHSRVMGSGALLANVLGRVLAEIPPGVVLPPTIGSAASLNLGFAVTGQSGDGKSATPTCGADVLGVDQEHLENGVGSGEGLIEAFLEERMIPDPRDSTKEIRAKVLIAKPAQIFEVDEVKQLKDVGERNGGTIMSTLRTALTGGALKTANATLERRRRVAKGSYRLVMFINVQPELSNILLDDVAAGTPQRLLWISTVDRTQPKRGDIPEWPGSLNWVSPFDVAAIHDYTIRYPDHVKNTIIDQRYDRVHGKGDPLESHLMLTRLKVAAGLAFLHGDVDITDLWWGIAGHLMAWSKQEQQRCLDALGKGRYQENVARGKAAGQQQLATKEWIDASGLEKAQERLKVVLGKLEGDATLPWSQARVDMGVSHREYREAALDSLVEAGVVEVLPTPRGTGKLLRLKCVAHNP